MSGGIDSSVAAYLLKKKGFKPIGVHFKFWPLENKCCSLGSENKAREICEKLKIPFYVFSLQKEFKKEIIKPFLTSLTLNITPNPCIWCNKKIKFKILEKYRKLLKADYVATGHYALIKQVFLYRAKDKKKDQSYFLWQVNNFEKVLFPLGNLFKKEVMDLAKKNNFCFSNTKESQEICFIPDKIEDFLKKNLKEKKGNIIFNNKIIGFHKGLFYYTIGQRKGINLSNGPFYVLKKDHKKNILFVTKDKKELEKNYLMMKNVRWFKKASSCLAQIRYQSSLVPVIIKDKKVIFKKPQTAVTPGQSIVFYKNNQVLGGGIIT